MVMMKRLLLTILAVVSCLSSASAFVTPPASSVARLSAATTTASTPTQLAERRWNFNEGRSPWGLAKNAEIWNGRVAQMAFVLTFLQELIQGKGVFQGIAEGNPINYAFLALFGVSTFGLTVFLAIKGDDDYTLD